MDDYYELLGVDADAPVDEIRAAYRDKRAAATGQNGENAKADAAALNKAWNVLSDPYQRGRYDQQRVDASEGDDGDDEDEEGAAPVVRRSKDRTPASTRRQPRPLPKPTVELPAGIAFAATKQRVTAMFIDLLILLALFISSLFLATAWEKSAHPAIYDTWSHLNKTSIPNAQSAEGDASKAASTADDTYNNLVKTRGPNAPETQSALADKKTKDDAKKKAQDKVTALTKQADDASSKLAPIQNGVSGIFFVVSLLLLAVPSLFGGATIGKRAQHIRVVRLDGSRARAGDIFRRYTLLVFAAYVLSTFLRSPVGALIVVFVATMWTRNPNRQGLHDRFAKTLVVADTDAGA